MQLVSTLATGEAQPRRKSPRNQLAKLAQRIKRYHAGTVELLRQSVDFAIMTGDLLLEAKELVPHGQWGEWVSRHCEMSDRTARLYMQLAQNREVIEAKTATVADLTLQGAAKAIATPKAKASPLPKAAQPTNEFEAKKRSTRHDLMAVWLNTPAEDRLHFMADVGLMWRQDAEVHEPLLPPPPPPVGSYVIPDDLSIPECLRVTA